MSDNDYYLIDQQLQDAISDIIWKRRSCGFNLRGKNGYENYLINYYGLCNLKDKITEIIISSYHLSLLY